MKRLLLLLTLGFTTLSVLIPTNAANAATRQRCFAETGFCVSGALLDYWEQNGGLAVFGYPISPERYQGIEGEWAGPVQWFERDRLEDHSNERKGVLAGRLGVRHLETQQRPWKHGEPMPVNPDCTFHQQTGYNVCGTFRAYWERNGGLARFGYPIGDPVEETIEGKTYTVQYFERRRMELHPENRGTPYEVLLGLLGRAVYNVEGEKDVMELAPGDVSATAQLPILDAAYAAIRNQHPRAKLAVGLVDIVGDYAAAIGQPFGQRPIYVYLAKRSNGWQVVQATANPATSLLRQQGIPEQLYANSEQAAVISKAVAHLQNPRGKGLNAYVTRPRLAGNWARLWFSPATAEGIDGVSAFFKKENGTWQFNTAGSAFPTDDLRQMGVPQELWPYGESVAGPVS